MLNKAAHDKPYYNDLLIRSMRLQGITQCYLLSSHSLHNLSKQELGNASAFLQPIIDHVQQQGLSVLGVITALDMVVKRGLGAYYEQHIQGFEHKLLKGETLGESFGQATAAESKWRDKKDEYLLAREEHLGQPLHSDIPHLYQYVVECLKAQSKLADIRWALSSDVDLEALQKMHQLQKYTHSLRCLKVEVQLQASDYYQWLVPAPLWKRILQMFEHFLSNLLATFRWLLGCQSKVEISQHPLVCNEPPFDLPNHQDVGRKPAYSQHRK